MFSADPLAFLTEEAGNARPLHLVAGADAIPAGAAADLARAALFTGVAGSSLLVPDADGLRLLVGVGGRSDPFALGDLVRMLPDGIWRFADPLQPEAAETALLAAALGAYRFTRKTGELPREHGRLAWPEGVDRARLRRLAQASFLVRDLCNQPANELGPQELEEVARTLAERHGADLSVIRGDDLLAQNWPLVHAVGRTAGPTRLPRVIDLLWGDPGHPLVTVVGKGVCFDTGGLDLKPASAMLMMKKDMGGAAHALGLFHLIADAGLKVRLRVLIPAVENGIGPNALRPLDVVRSRKGLTVEIGNTDAEGRLILADALAEAAAEAPKLIVDFATLTGAARIALGPDLPALFSSDDPLAEDLLAAATAAHDPLWRMPLWQGYLKDIEGKVADWNNTVASGLAGAIGAALFLEQFVKPVTAWAHLDTHAWNLRARPGRPEGGEAQGLRAVYTMIERRFGGAA